MTEAEDAIDAWKKAGPLIMALLDLAATTAEDLGASPICKAKAVMCLRLAAELKTLLEQT